MASSSGFQASVESSTVCVQHRGKTLILQSHAAFHLIQPFVHLAGEIRHALAHSHDNLACRRQFLRHRIQLCAKSNLKVSHCQHEEIKIVVLAAFDVPDLFFLVHFRAP